MPICLKDETFSESDLEMKLGQPPGEATLVKLGRICSEG